jgi:hypothetical protein
MKTLHDYSHFSIHGEDGLAGDCFELALHDYFGQDLRVSGNGIVDLKAKVSAKVKTYNKVEVKTGAGQIPNNLKGNSYVIYCPVVDLSLPLRKQEAFVVKRTVFIQCLQEAECYRISKRTTAGTTTEAIQTFWNRKLNKPHGRKLEKLLDALYASGCQTLEEWLEEA